MTKRVFVLAILIAILRLSSRAFAADGQTMIADFDKGEPVNNLGQPVEVWLKDDGKDDTQKTVLTFAADDAAGNAQGHCAVLDYDVDSPNPAYNGIRMNLNNFDAREFKTLHFFVKGDSKKGFGKKIKIELIPAKTKQPSPYLFDGVTDQWQEVSVPLSEFWGIGDQSSLEQFTVVFADIVNAPKTGTIYLDQISFSKG